jgi:hypothetical protein
MQKHHSKSNEEAISLCFQTAIEKLEKVDADAEKEKTQIVLELAASLEGKIPTNSICNEIVHQLRKKVHERTIRNCLDEKYKEKHRVENARKQKRKRHEDLAASVPLEPKQQIAATQDGKSVIINETSSNIDTISSESNQNGFAESEQQEYKNVIDDDADQVSRLELEFTILKARYGDLRQAMRKSQNLIHLIFDKSRTFMRAVPDVDKKDLEPKGRRRTNDNGTNTNYNDTHHHHRH